MRLTALTTWSQTARAVVSELLTNAIQAAPGQRRVWLRLSHRPGFIAVEVGDSSAGYPEPGEVPGSEDERGRGLLIVDRLSEERGCYQLPGAGKVVMTVLRAWTAGG